MLTSLLLASVGLGRVIARDLAVDFVLIVHQDIMDGINRMLPLLVGLAGDTVKLTAILAVLALLKSEVLDSVDKSTSARVFVLQFAVDDKALLTKHLIQSIKARA
jgi:hypothetical protein